MGAQRGVGLQPGEAGHERVGGGVDGGEPVGAEAVVGGGAERVVVAVGGGWRGAAAGSAERRVAVLVADTGASSRARMRVRMSTAVGGSSASRVMTRVRVAVAGGGEVDVVGVPAAGHRDVEQLPGFLAGGDGVAGVGGDALGAVHGGGVAELDVVGDVVGGQGDVPSGAQVGDVQGAGVVDGGRRSSGRRS